MIYSISQNKIYRYLKTIHKCFVLAGDCFELGRQSYNSYDFYHTELWMNEALKRHEQERSNVTVRWEILEYLAYSTFMQGK